MHRFDYFTPNSLAETLDLLRAHGADAKVLAGGTDLVPQMKERGRHPKAVVSLKNIDELRGIRFSAEGLTVGATTRFGVLQRDPMVVPHYPIIVQTAKLIGSLQTQNLATIGGNICNAAPSADAVPAFIITDTVATIQGSNGSRTIPLTDVFQGPGRTAIAPDELLTALTVPVPLPRAAGIYIRHMPRKELDIAIAGVGVYVQLDAAYDKITHARVCLASVGPTPLRATEAEAALLGQSATDELFRHVGDIAARESQPITDHRGSAIFRRTLVRGLTQRTLSQAVETIRRERLELEKG